MLRSNELSLLFDESTTIFGAYLAVYLFLKLITLVMIFIRLNLFDNNKTFGNKLFAQFPLTIYFAWLCVASIANISLYLVATDWNGFGIESTIWAITLIIFTVVLSIIIIAIKRNPFFGLVIIWALYGIILKRASVDETAFSNVIITAWIGLGIVSILTIFQWYKITFYQKKQLNA